MTLRLFDTHAHLNIDAFADDVDEVVNRARQAGVVGINVIGIDVATSRRACDLAAAHPGYLFAVVGIQPNCAAEASPDDFAIIEQLAGMPGVRAIGETGLDCYWDDTPLSIQHEYFDRHMQLCRDTSLPMVIHMRESASLIVDQLRRQVFGTARRDAFVHGRLGNGKAVPRSWTLCQLCRHGHVQEERRPASGRGRRPRRSLLIETDSPYLSPEPLRGKRPNEPARVEHTLRCLAETRGVAAEHLAEVTTDNAKRLFQLP